MNKQQIAFMMQNGFTIDEIMAIGGTPAPEPDPAPAPEPDPAPAPKQEPNAMEERFSTLVQTVDNLVKTIQNNNINAIQFGSPVADRTAEDVLAEIINPKRK